MWLRKEIKYWQAGCIFLLFFLILSFTLLSFFSLFYSSCFLLLLLFFIIICMRMISLVYYILNLFYFGKICLYKHICSIPSFPLGIWVGWKFWEYTSKYRFYPVLIFGERMDCGNYYTSSTQIDPIWEVDMFFTSILFVDSRFNLVYATFYLLY